MSRELNIHINIEDVPNCKITFINDDGTKINKCVSYDDLIEIMNASTTNETIEDKLEVGFVSEIFPCDDIIKTLAVKEIKSTGAIWYVLLRESVPHDMIYRGKRYKNIGMPRMIFAIKVYQGRCATMGISAIKDEHVSENTEIYNYPFSNVFGPTSVCLGGNSISTFDLVDTTSIRYIPDMFLEMPNNNHGFSESRSGGLTYEKFIESLKDKDFDNGILKTANMNLKKLIKILK